MKTKRKTTAKPKENADRQQTPNKKPQQTQRDETTPTNETRKGNHQPPDQTTTKQQTPQNSERNLKISALCERAHSKLLTYNTGDEVTSDDCGHHSELRKSNHAPKATELDRPARYIPHQTPNYADDLENPNSTRRQVENGNWFP